MSYIAQIIVFILAILGALFKSVKQDEKGNTVHSKSGIPILTRPGIILVFFLIISFIVSIYLTWNNNKESKAKEQASEANSKGLQQKLEDVTAQNDRLQESLMSANEVNLQGFKDVLRLQEEKHKANLEEFKSLFDQQKSLYGTTLKGFERALNPIKDDIRISLGISISGNQEKVKSYIKRISPFIGSSVSANGNNLPLLFPRLILEKPSVADHYVFLDPAMPPNHDDEYEKDLSDVFHGLGALVVISDKPFGANKEAGEIASDNIHTWVERLQQTSQSWYSFYDKSNNSILLEATSCKVERWQIPARFSSMLDLLGGTALIGFYVYDQHGNTKISESGANELGGIRLDVEYIELISSSNHRLYISGFKPVPDIPYRSFYATIPPKAKWR